VTDESGIETPNVTAGSTLNSASTGFGAVNLTSGDRTNGTWQAILTVPQGATSGEWEVLLFPLKDNADNSTGFLPGAGFDATFNVVKNGDIPNNVPVIEFDTNLNFEERVGAVITPVVTDIDSDVLTYSWEQTSGQSVSINNYYATSLEFIAPSVGQSSETLDFQLTVSDGKDDSVSNITVNILNINQAPTVSITANTSYEEGTTVTLTASASDADEDDLTYAWSQVSGPTLSINDASSSSATFAAPMVNSDTNVVVKVVVSDSYTQTSLEKTILIKDKVTINNDNSADESSGGSMGYLILFFLVMASSRKIVFKRYD
jgi:hypothetical protein